MLPKYIYEPLPYFYLAVGAGSAALMESSLKYLPATLFLVAGLLVLSMRKSSRASGNKTRSTTSEFRVVRTR